MTEITVPQKSALQIMKLACEQSDRMARAADALGVLIPLVRAGFGSTDAGRLALEKASRSHAELLELKPAGAQS